jgi:exodeoxyribonuclease V beta subunit
VVEREPVPPAERWTADDLAPAPLPDAAATVGRPLDRTRSRWSFTAISRHDRLADLDPGDHAHGDAGAADEGPATEPLPGPDGADQDPSRRGAAPAVPELQLPLGSVPGGAAFGTLVHHVLEEVDFAADDLEAALDAPIAELGRWNDWPVAPAVVRDGLRAAIESPLGPLLADRRLRGLGRADRLDELAFDLRLADQGPAVSVARIGRLLLRHLAPGDPLRPWAEDLAAGRFPVALAGNLTGSIDAVLRVPGASGPHPHRYVVVDYKTNTLGPRGEPPDLRHYRPDRLPAAMAHHHYPLQALLYAVALHRFLRWRLRGYDPAQHLGGAAYLFVRGMVGAATPLVDGHPCGVFSWPLPPALVTAVSDLLDGRAAS